MLSGAIQGPASGRADHAVVDPNLVVAALVVVALAAALSPVLWGARRPQRAHRTRQGVQEARIVVEHGYRPSRIELEAGIPTRLRFDRREDDACSEMLVSELWPSQHRLVPHGETEIRFTPERPGRYAFTCGMGRYSGELIVRGGRAT